MERIGLLAIPKVLGLLRGCPRLYGISPPATTDRPASVLNQQRDLKIRSCGAGRLPDAFEIWLAISRARQSLWKGDQCASRAMTAIAATVNMNTEPSDHKFSGHKRKEVA
jgi:hypothetical protein